MFARWLSFATGVCLVSWTTSQMIQQPGLGAACSTTGQGLNARPCVDLTLSSNALVCSANGVCICNFAQGYVATPNNDFCVKKVFNSAPATAVANTPTNCFIDYPKFSAIGASKRTSVSTVTSLTACKFTCDSDTTCLAVEYNSKYSPPLCSMFQTSGTYSTIALLKAKLGLAATDTSITWSEKVTGATCPPDPTVGCALIADLSRVPCKISAVPLTQQTCLAVSGCCWDSTLGVTNACFKSGWILTPKQALCSFDPTTSPTTLPTTTQVCYDGCTSVTTCMAAVVGFAADGTTVTSCTYYTSRYICSTATTTSTSIERASVYADSSSGTNKYPDGAAVCGSANTWTKTADVTSNPTAVFMPAYVTIQSCMDACARLTTDCAAVEVNRNHDPMACSFIKIPATAPTSSTSPTKIDYYAVGSTCSGIDCQVTYQTFPQSNFTGGVSMTVTYTGADEKPCSSLCTSDPTCAGYQISYIVGSNGALTPSTCQMFPMSGPLLSATPAKLLKTSMSNLYVRNTEPCLSIGCSLTAGWDVIPDVASPIFVSYPTATTLSACQTWCQTGVLNCLGIQYEIGAAAPCNLLYNWASVAARVSAPGFTQYMLRQTPNCVTGGRCTAQWRVNNGTTSTGGTFYRDTTTLFDCQNRCERLSGGKCVGIEMNNTRQPPVCKVFTDINDVKVRVPANGNDQYLLIRSCGLALATIDCTVPGYFCSDANAECDTGSKQCKCKTGYTADATTGLCLGAKKLGDTCAATDFCADLNAVCAGATVPNEAGTCVCATGYVENDVSACVPSSQCAPQWWYIANVNSYAVTTGMPIAAFDSGTTTLSACRRMCARQIVNCFGITLDRSTSTFKCLIHVNDVQMVARVKDANFDQYVLMQRCTSQSAPCSTQFAAYQDTSSVGGIRDPTSNTLADCLSGCAGSCVGIDMDYTQSPHTCWRHYNSANMVDMANYKAVNVVQYRVNKMCPDGVDSSATTSVQNQAAITIGNYNMNYSTDITSSVDSTAADASVTDISGCLLMCSAMGNMCTGVSVATDTFACKLFKQPITTASLTAGSKIQLFPKIDHAMAICYPSWAKYPNMVSSATATAVALTGTTEIMCLRACALMGTCAGVTWDESKQTCSGYKNDFSVNTLTAAAATDCKTTYALTSRCNQVCNVVYNGTVGRYTTLIGAHVAPNALTLQQCDAACRQDVNCDYYQTTKSGINYINCTLFSDRDSTTWTTDSSTTTYTPTCVIGTPPYTSTCQPRWAALVNISTGMVGDYISNATGGANTCKNYCVDKLPGCHAIEVSPYNDALNTVFCNYYVRQANGVYNPNLLTRNYNSTTSQYYLMQTCPKDGFPATPPPPKGPNRL